MGKTRFSKKHLERALIAVFALAALFLFVDYWVLSPKPILSAFFAVVHANLGDIKELPFAEKWTGRYTQRIVPRRRAGLILKNGLVFLPFPAKIKNPVLDVEMRSLVVSRRYAMEAEILRDDAPVSKKIIGPSWEILSLPLSRISRVKPSNLKIRFDLIETSDPGPGQDGFFKFEPRHNAFWSWKKSWTRMSLPFRTENYDLALKENVLIVNGLSLVIDDCPITILDERLDVIDDSKALVDIPYGAIRSLRLREKNPPGAGPDKPE